MQTSLIAAGFMLGLIGSPHCAAMCGGPVTVCLSRCSGSRATRWAAFNGARLVSYSAVGFVLGLALTGASQLSNYLRAVQPFWTLLHATIAMAGLWLLISGRQPAFLRLPLNAPRSLAVEGDARTIQFTPKARAWRPAALGAAWGLMPCGLLYSALLTTALATTPLDAALTMLAFGLGTSAAFVLLPAVLAVLPRVPGYATLRTWNRKGDLALRASGAALCAVSAWVLLHGPDARAGGLFCF
jgi:sulfite exporter TauE/SafE